MNASFWFQYLFYTLTWLVPVIFYYHLTKLNTYFQWNLGWLFCIYFSYRYWFPATRWPAFRKSILELSLHSYFNKGRIFGGITKCNEKVLYLWYSKSFLSIGFINYGLTNSLWDKHNNDSPNSSPTQTNEPIEWLVPINLLRFPIISDILRWLGCTINTNKNLQNLMFNNRKICCLISHDTNYSNFDKKSLRNYINLAILYGYSISMIYTVEEDQLENSLQINGPLKTLLWNTSMPLSLIFKQMPEPNVELTTVITEPVSLVKTTTAQTSVVDYYMEKIVDKMTVWKQ